VKYATHFGLIAAAVALVFCFTEQPARESWFLMDRIAALNEILEQNPDDTFARYGLAMEFSRIGDVEGALEEFKKLLSAHPDYTAGYFMAAQTLAKCGRNDEAVKMLSDGIVSASRTGNAHAQSEMEAMLSELS